MRILSVNLFMFFAGFLICSCQKTQEQTSFYQVKTYRYMQGNPYEPSIVNLDLQIDNQGDTLVKYAYSQQDTITKARRVLMDIEVKNDSILLMKIGDYLPNTLRVLQAKKIFYAGSKEIEVSKFVRVEKQPDKDDAVFIAREFGIVNMLSYSLKTKVLYKISADKAAASMVNKINTYLEKDTLGFYHQPNQ